MTDTLTTAKSLTKQTVGGNSGTWGTILNSSLDLIDKALGQTLTKALSVNVTLTATEAQNIGYDFTGALAAAVTVTFPTFYGPAFIRNKTTGGFTVTVGMASGTTVQVPASSNAFVFSDGTDFVLGSPTPATFTGQPTNPGSTNSTTRKMMGLGSTCKITPRKTGIVVFHIEGYYSNTSTGGLAYLMRYGTGSAPANLDAVTGSSNLQENIVSDAPSAVQAAFSTTQIVTGLTVGTQVWFDLHLATITTGFASVGSLSATAFELS